MSPSRRRTSTGSWSSRHRKFRAREVEDVDPLLLDRQPRLPEGLAEPQVEAGEGEPGLQLVVGVARGDAVGVGVGLREEGEELGGDIGGGGVGGLGVGDAWSSGAVEEVHDALAADEDAEDLAGELVYDFETAAPGGAEVEEGVAEGEVEDVGMAGTPLKPSRLESHTGSPGASITRMERPAPPSAPSADHTASPGTDLFVLSPRSTAAVPRTTCPWSLRRCRLGSRGATS